MPPPDTKPLISHTDNDLRQRDLWPMVFVSIFSQYWRLILTTTVFFTVAAALVAFLMTPAYEVRVVLVQTTKPEGAGQLGGMLGGIGQLAVLAGGENAPDRKQEALAILKSRQFTENFIESHNLLPVIFADDWNPETEQWLVNDPPTLFDGYNVFESEIRRISENLTEGTVTVSVVWHDRFEAARWANLMVESLNQNMRKRAIDEAQRTLTFLGAELAKTDVLAVRQAIFSLTEDNFRTIAMANVQDEYVFRVIDPAAPPDADAFIRPKRVILILAGLGIGLLAGFFIALSMARYRQLYENVA